MTQPLAGVRVIECCNVAAGPFCGMLLADLGADVIKVENPRGGDSLRYWPPLTEGFSENFASLNRNKRSVTLDLKSSRDRSKAHELMCSADVVLENNRPGVMGRLNLDYSAIQAANPKIVYCSISAFGQDGPRSREGGFDLTIQAMSGIMSVTGEPESAPVKCGIPVSDFSTGLYAALAIVSALLEARLTGHGSHVDASLFGSSLAVAALQTSEYFGAGTDPRRLGSAHPRNAPYQAFRTADGHLALAAGNDALWEAVCHAIDREDLTHDARFLSTEARARHQEALREILETHFAQATSEDLLERFRAAGVPCAPINNYSAALADPQVAHMGWVQDITLPSGRGTKTFASPLRFDGEAPPIYRNPPALGAHNEEVLGTAPTTRETDRG